MPAIIQNTPVFTPFSFEQYIAPLNAYKQEYDTVEKQYNEVEAAASALEALAASAPNSQAYRTYRDYINGLRAEADALAYNGLTPGSRQRLRNIRTGYTSNIVPILAGVQKWEKEKERWNNLKSHERLSSGNPYEQGPDDYIGKNPSSRIIDLNDAYVKGAQQGAAQSSRQQELYESPFGKSVLEEEYWYIHKLNGYINGSDTFDKEIEDTNDLIEALAAERRSQGYNVTSAGQEGLYHMLQGIGLDDLNTSVKKELLQFTIAGYISGLNGEIKDNFLGRRSQNGSGSGSDTSPYGATSVWAGSKVTTNTKELEQLKNDLEVLTLYEKGQQTPPPKWDPNNDLVYKEMVEKYNTANKQKSPYTETYKTALEVYASKMNEEGDTNYKQYQTSIKRIEQLQELYNTKDLTRLREILENQLTYNTNLNAERVLNPADNELIVKKLNQHIVASDLFGTGSKTADDSKKISSLWTYKKDNGNLKQATVSPEEYQDLIKDPNLTISIDPTQTDPNTRGAIILKAPGKPAIHVSNKVFNNVTVPTRWVKGSVANLPDNIENLFRDATITIYGAPATTMSFDEFIDLTLTIYDAYKQTMIKDISNEDKLKYKYTEPKVLLGEMLNDAFEALRVNAAQQYRQSQTSNKDENR